MTDIARQPAGIPVGGQFAATTHGEPDVTLGSTVRPELEGWPESLPEPELDFTIANDGGVITKLSAGDLGNFEIFSDDDDHTDYTCYEGEWDGVDEDTFEAAYEWGAAKHRIIEARVLAESRQALAVAKARIAAEVTGKTPVATDEQLEFLIESAAAIREESEAAAERSSAALAARKVLAAHPTAALARLEVTSWDNGDFVSGAVILDAGGNEVADYSDSDDESQDEIRTLFTRLNPNAEDSFYYDFTVAEGKAFDYMTHEESLLTIDLKKAEAWNPGAKS